MIDSKDSLEDTQDNKQEEQNEKDKLFRQLSINDKVNLIVSELVSDRLKSISDKYENQQASIDKYNEMLNSLYSSAEKILANLEKANEVKQPVKTPTATPSAAIKKAQGQGSLMSQLMGLSTGLPVINEAVHPSRLTSSVSTLPAQANLSKIASIAAALPGAARQNRGSKVATKENTEEENHHKPKEIKETKQEKLQVIDEAPVKPQKETHQKTPSNVPTSETPSSSKAAVPKINDLKTQRNLVKNKSMVQLKSEEGVKTDKSKFSDAAHQRPERKQSTIQKKDDSGQKQKQEDDEPKQKIERKPAIPKAGGAHTGSDGKSGKDKNKESANVSQFNSNDPKSTKSKDPHSKGKSGTVIQRKQSDDQIPESSKIIPRRPQQTQPQEPVKQEEQKEEQKVSEQIIKQQKEEDDLISQAKQLEKQKSILEEITKQVDHDDENLLDDIDHKAENAANQEQQKPVEQQQATGELDVKALDQLIKDFFEGKVESNVISDFCVKNVTFNEQIDEHLIFAQIDLQKIVEDFNANNPNAIYFSFQSNFEQFKYFYQWLKKFTKKNLNILIIDCLHQFGFFDCQQIKQTGDFSESFQLQSSTKEGLQLIEINFMQEMMEKDEFDESVMNMFEVVFVILNGPELEKYRNAESQEYFIREYMNENYDNFVKVIESFEGKVEVLNKNYSIKKFIKEYIEKYEFITDQDYYFAIEPLCALLSPVIEEIIIFMGLKETSQNKKNVLYYKHQINQAQQKRISELNQIIVNNTYLGKND